jgi:hypothetical protein
METFNAIGMDILRTGATVGIMTAVGASDLLPITSDTVLNRALKGGVVFTGASDVVNWVTDGHSKALTMDYYGVADDIFFYSGVNGLADVSGLGRQLYLNLDNLMGSVDSQIKNALVNGAILSTSRLVSKYAQNNVGEISPALHRLTHITSLLK